jgi:hypothetical protein
MPTNHQQFKLKAQPVDLGEVTSEEFCNTVPADVNDVVLQYAFSTEWVHKQFLFGGADTSLYHILSLAEHAGPLDQFEFYVRKYAENLKKTRRKNKLLEEIFIIDGVQGNLIQILKSRLDVSLRKEDGTKINEGMADRFIKLVGELWPDRLPEVLIETPVARLFEEEKAIIAEDDADLENMMLCMSAILQLNDEELIQQSLEVFNQVMMNKKACFSNDEGYLTDNRYYIKLINLIFAAFSALKQGTELLGEDSDDEALCDSLEEKAHRFCVELIGGILQRDLPPRIRQILKSGMLDLFCNHRKVIRDIDTDGAQFLGHNTENNLGHNSYYDDIGLTQMPRAPIQRIANFFGMLSTAIDHGNRALSSKGLETPNHSFIM